MILNVEEIENKKPPTQYYLDWGHVFRSVAD